MKAIKGRNIVPFLVLLSGLITLISCMARQVDLLKTLISVIIVMMIFFIVSLIARKIFQVVDDKADEKIKLIEQEKKAEEIRIQEERERQEDEKARQLKEDKKQHTNEIRFNEE